MKQRLVQPDITGYHLLFGESAEDLTAKVQEKMNSEGYEPYGFPYLFMNPQGNVVVYQAVVQRRLPESSRP